MKKGQKEILVDIFNDFVSTFSNKEYYQFDLKYIFSHDLWRFSKKMGLKNLLISVGINPDCVYTSKKGFYLNKEEFLFRIMDELEDTLGRENLNYNSIEKSEKIVPPPSMRTKGSFHLTEKHNFPLKKMSPVTLLVGLERTFNLKWDEILIKTGRVDIKRKVSKYSIEEVYQSFVSSITTLYGCNENDLMTNPYDYILLSDVKKHDKRLTSQLNKFSSRILNKKNKQIQKILDKESDFLVSIEILHFYWKKKTLSGVDDYILNVDDFSEKNQKINIIKKRKDNHEQNQKDMLIGYSEGYFGHGDYFGDETLYRYINHMKTSTDTYFKKIGIELKTLGELKNKLDRKYNSREKIWVRLRGLVKESIKDNSNYLTREWIEKNDPELLKDSFIVENVKTNSWEKVLKLYGLNPMVWNNSYPLRSYRGFVFEKSIKTILKKHLREVKSINQIGSDCFIHNKLIDKGIKPDFIFSELIMDTKFSVTFDKNNIINSTVSKQMEKYYDYFKLKVVILTFNQKERLLKTQNKQYEIELINISSFSKFMSKYFKIKINNQELKEVFENINNVPFWKTT